jgi:putative heme-binding domain-containing protein
MPRVVLFRLGLSLLLWMQARPTVLAEESSNGIVHLLIPGFRARELPVRLSNINNLLFTPEGKLTAVGYDGRIHLLTDSDGDGLEDKASDFWSEPTLTVPVGAFWGDEGLYVSSHGKISLLRDTNGDGKADREEVLATNWPPTATWTGNVDATAITEAKDGQIYFGLLTENYANPYLVVDGVAHYNLQSKRGTIQRFDPKSSTLETIATGIRVPYDMHFNKAGDLFVTDQEGATWCPNGNPLDELNEIKAGKNYGFPPRHPIYLPNLMSEPPVVGFGPQHESTCGFVFNEPSARQKLFGPSSWEDDAIVAGESRGKIWRVPLVKTPFGYLGKDMLLARLRMLTTDVAISPRGELYVSCHSGLPDWGTGPKGEGKIFKITYQESSAPLPVAAWAENDMEVRVAFDKAIPSGITNNPADFKIDFGEYVRPADRLENLKPPYKVVAEQEATPRGELKVVAARLSADQRTLILTTDPHPANVSYAVSIPWKRSEEEESERIDVGYDLKGVEASWTAEGKSTPEWRGWFPHLDSGANRIFTLNSAEHENFYAASAEPGELSLRTRIEPPERTSRIKIVSSEPMRARSLGGAPNGTGEAPVVPSAGGGAQRGQARARVLPGSRREGSNYVVEMSVAGGKAVGLSLQVKTGGGEKPELHAAYLVEKDPTWRTLPFSAFDLPWAPEHQAVAPEQAGSTGFVNGDFENGRGLFFGEKLKCSTCHTIRGKGGKIGPDLSNLAQRDPASVLRDIKEPNASLNPDFVSYNVELKDGETLSGFLRAQSATTLRLEDAAGKERLISRKEVESQQVSAVSLMPSGLLDTASEGEIRDLLTFLTNVKPARDPADVERILKTSSAPGPEEPLKQVRIVLVASKQDHGAGQHDYPHWQTNFHAFLSRARATLVEDAWEWPSAEQFQRADCLVFYYWNHKWTPERYGQVDGFLARGGGMAVFHSATISDDSPEELARRIGLAAEPVHVKYIHTPFDLKFVAPTNDPITAGFSKLHFIDEPYWPMIGDTNRIKVLAVTEREGRERPLVWTFEKGKGRVFASIPGHYTWTQEDPMFRILALRGIAWTMREEPGRFLGLLNQNKDGN